MGLVPLIALAQNAGRIDLADDRLTASTTGAEKGAKPRLKPKGVVANVENTKQSSAETIDGE